MTFSSFKFVISTWNFPYLSPISFSNTQVDVPTIATLWVAFHLRPLVWPKHFSKTHSQISAFGVDLDPSFDYFFISSLFIVNYIYYDLDVKYIYKC